MSTGCARPQDLCGTLANDHTGSHGVAGGYSSPGDEIRLQLDREMPSLLTREPRVVRFIPSRAAAPVGPPIIHFVSLSVRRICSRSTSLSLVGISAEAFANDETFCRANSSRGGWSTESSERITDRSTKFSSSRTLPGQ